MNGVNANPKDVFKKFVTCMHDAKHRAQNIDKENEKWVEYNVLKGASDCIADSNAVEQNILHGLFYAVRKQDVYGHLAYTPLKDLANKLPFKNLTNAIGEISTYLKQH